MTITIKAENHLADYILQLSDDEMDNPNFVDVNITRKGREDEEDEPIVSLTVPIHELERAVHAFSKPDEV